MSRGGIDLTHSHARSKTATAVGRLDCAGVVMFQLMKIIAVIALLLAGSFLIFANEPLWTRFLTFVAIGLIPSLISYAIGWLMYLIFRAADAAYDPVADWALVLGRMLTNVVKRC